jgi:hypothetical protein
MYILYSKYGYTSFHISNHYWLITLLFNELNNVN